MSDVETGVSSDSSISIEMGEKKVTEAGSGIESTPEQNLIEFTDLEGDEEENLEADGEEQGAEDDGTDGDDVDGDDTALEDLGEFDPEDTEKWDAQYKGEDGKLNQEALSKEFWANGTDDSPGQLNEGTYAYLESIGISKQMAKDVEAALVTQADATKTKAEKRDDALFARVAEITGDAEAAPDVLKDALKWGKEGGYTKAQQERFNKVLKGTDEDARVEAVELLVGRFQTANGGAKQKPRLPKRDATNGRGAPGGTGLKPFKNRAEARQARRDAGNDQKARQKVAQRMALGFSGE